MPSPRRTKLFGGLRFTIDRPKGTVKSWPQPDGSIKTFTYPVDYGYLPRHTAEDEEGLDFFVGDDPDGHLESFQKLKDGRFDETKFLVGVTDAEREAIYALYGPEIWHRRTYRTMDELSAHLTPFRGATDPRFTLLFGTHGRIEKTAGVLDSLKRMFGRGAPQTAHAASPLHSPTLLPAAPSHLPQTGNFHETTLPVLPTGAHSGTPAPAPIPKTRVSYDTTSSQVPQTRSRPAAPSSAESRVSFPAPSPSFSGRVDHTPSRAPITPVRRTTYADLLAQAPGMQETLKHDLRARAALGARPVRGGGFELTRHAAANTLGTHLLQNAPGARITPDLIRSTMATPEYQSARAAYKHAKLAALARLGFKAGAAKFADIAKRLNAEVLLSSPDVPRSVFEQLR